MRHAANLVQMDTHDYSRPTCAGGEEDGHENNKGCGDISDDFTPISITLLHLLTNQITLVRVARVGVL